MKAGRLLRCSTIALLYLSAAASAAQVDVESADGGIRLRVQRGDPQAVVAELGRVFVADVRGTTLSHEPISLDASFARVDEALRRIVGEQSFVVVYRPDGTPRRIELLGAAVDEPSASKSAPRGFDDSVATVPAAAEPLGNGDAVVVSRRLGSTLGTTRPTLGTLLRSLPALPEARDRREALLALGAAVDRRPELGAAVVSLLDDADEDLLVEAAVGALGADGGRTLHRLIRRTRDPGLRARLERLAARIAER
jgi:hypothetical protein